MNLIDFSQPGGFPLDQDVLAKFQNNITLAATMARIGGSYYVLSGCFPTGNGVTDGVVVINGEILPFVGGTITEKVVIIQSATNLIYEDGEARPTEYTRFATFGDDGITTILWAAFKRNDEGMLARLERLERIASPFLNVIATDGTVHRGGMVLWKKPAILIPTGWQEVQDWRGRLPMGYDPVDTAFNEVGKSGGQKVRYLDQTHLPTNLNLKVGTYNEGGAGKIASGGGGMDGDIVANFINTGGGQALDILNPYRVVMFIEYTGS